MAEQTYLIVGAGLAGGNAALELRRQGFEGAIVLVGSEPDPPYNRPPLSKGYLRAEEKLEQILCRPADEYAANNVDLRLGTTVDRVRAGDRVVELQGGVEIRYDRLLLTTGGRNRRPPIPGIDLKNVFQLRTRADSDAIREAASAGGRVVVVGLGFIGSEVTASLRMRGIEVTALEAEPVPLARVLGPAVGGTIADLHRDHGVELVLGDGLSSFEGTGRVERVRTKSGRVIDCDVVIAGLGIEPNSDLLEAAGAGVDNGVLTDEFCATSLPDVFAAGDVANRQHPLFGVRMRTEHWNNADRAGTIAAHNMLGQRRAFDDVPSFWSDQYDTTLEYVGHHREFDSQVIRGDLEGRRFFAFYMQAGVIQSIVAMGYGDEVVPRLEPLIRLRKPVKEDQLRDESTDLTALAEGSAY